MSKTIDEVTQDELESLYLENDWDVKKIAEKTGWGEYVIGCKFASFYNTPEKRQDLIYRFKIINFQVLKKLSYSIYKRRSSISYYQIPLEELIDSYKINNSFKEIAKKYRTTEHFIVIYFNSQINTQEDFDKVIKEFNIKSSTEFNRKFNGLYSKAKKLGIKLSFIRDLSEFINDIEKIKRHVVDELGCVSSIDLQRKDSYFYKKIWCNLDKNTRSYILSSCRTASSYVSKFNSPFEAVQYYTIENKIKTTVELEKSWYTLYRDYFLLLTPEEKELIFPGYTSRSGWEKEMRENLQKEFSDCIIIAQKRFKDCKNVKQLPFDLALFSPSDELICLIEIHGATHFTEVHGNFEGIRKRDIIKYEYCKKNKISLLYFTYRSSLIEKYGYPYFVYTDFEELVKAIRELLQKVS